MKLTALALFASFAVAGYVEAQTAPSTPPTDQAPAPGSKAESAHHHPLSSACRKEVSNLCGTTHGKEMMSCVKDNLDSNKFSADCQTELKAHGQEPAKPAS